MYITKEHPAWQPEEKPDSRCIIDISKENMSDLEKEESSPQQQPTVEYPRWIIEAEEFLDNHMRKINADEQQD